MSPRSGFARFYANHDGFAISHKALARYLHRRPEPPPFLLFAAYSGPISARPTPQPPPVLPIGADCPTASAAPKGLHPLTPAPIAPLAPRPDHSQAAQSRVRPKRLLRCQMALPLHPALRPARGSTSVPVPALPPQRGGGPPSQPSAPPIKPPPPTAISTVSASRPYASHSRIRVPWPAKVAGASQAWICRAPVRAP